MNADTPRHVLVRVGWQDCNLGDVAHAPGALAWLERHVPEARPMLWSFTPLTVSVREMIVARFPNVDIVQGAIGPDGTPTTDELRRAFDECDLFLHGSGPATIAWRDAATFGKLTGKPFGVCGVTYGLYGIPERQALSDAAFVYFRDSRSLARAKAEGVRPPIIGVSPDVAFAFDIRDDRAAETYLARVGLKPGKFICCIPRMRCTPFWEVERKHTAFDPVKHARNEETKESDHARLLEAIVAVVRQTDLRVLVCPEDETQIALAKEMLIDRLPDDVRPRVVWRDTFWLPDEALAVYVRSVGLFGNEMHSPILCVAHGVPAVVCHSRDASTKGFMWQDVGLGHWLFDLDTPGDLDRIVPTVLSIATDPTVAKAKADAAGAVVRQRLEATAAVVREHLGLGQRAGARVRQPLVATHE